ncbi:MAG TPA: DEAD/DEAH box helicase [Solirubrobacteraceae bacterium]|nr:DEAD/DEAH box helicase [Solirubrobacteraceae bacterium]
MTKELSFAELGASRAVVNALSEQGIDAPFAIQQKVIADVLAGRDVLARSPTGSGKTLAFGIPLIDRIASDGPRPAALVLAPTRELATQIVDELRPIAHARALRITAVYGGVGLVKQGKDAAGAHIIVATPGRLEDQLERGAFDLRNVQVLVLDEADRMLDMGFKPAVDRIVARCTRRDRQTLFFSATLDGPAGQAARNYTQAPVEHEHGPQRRQANAAIEHRFVEIAHEHRVAALVEQLSASDRELSLVFVRTKRGADRLVKRLADHSVKSVAMHGDKSQRQRERALAQFENWEVDVLVATDVAARGIDVSGITHVINFDPPEDSDTYVHRVGRTARAGAQGIGITLLSPEQRHEVARMAGDLGIEHGLAGAGQAVRGAAPSHQDGGRSTGGARSGGGRGGSAPRPGSAPRSAGTSRTAPPRAGTSPRNGSAPREGAGPRSGAGPRGTSAETPTPRARRGGGSRSAGSGRPSSGQNRSSRRSG